jgi:hypothetical protein
MARRHLRNAPALAFDALMVEGALISPAMVARIAAHQAEGQSEGDYSIPKGLTMRDEIARYFRIGEALFAALTAAENASAGATIKFVEGLLRDVFGFTDLKRIGSRTRGDRQFAVTLEGLAGRVPIVVVPPVDELDRPSDHLPTDGRRRSAASAIQDWLNADEASLWGFCCNGFRLRLVRDNASLTRPAYIEADLRAIFQEENFADFTALWLLAHASRFGRPDAPPSDCPLERWREAGQKEGVAARDRLRDGVEAALLSVGNGFLAHPNNGALRERLHSRELSLTDFFSQLLRLVYRLIFLSAAEDRDLLHPPGTSATARKLYAEGYSLTALRDSAVRRAAWDRHHDRWEGLLITFAALARGEKRLGLPALDGLFAPGTLPDLENTKLANRSLMEAIYRVAWLKDDSGLVPINWRDMETEELGSVYESLLELTPQLTKDGRAFSFAEGGEAKGHARKTTGSYYTPDSLVQALLDSALDPVLDRIEAEVDDPTTALLSVTVLDPACGSGHFLLAAARRIATRLGRARAGGVASPADSRHALREVVRACIYGVDRNPMAVELTKVALWIETVEPGKPLGFLDANIRCGDSLFGVFDLKALAQGIPDAAYKPLTGDDKATARYFLRRNRDEREGQARLDFTRGDVELPEQALLVRERRALRAMPEDSTADIAERRRRFEAARADRRSHALGEAADLYIAAFLLTKTDDAPASGRVPMVPTTGDVWRALADKQVHPPLVARAVETSRAARAFHWPLAFPDVMAAGGFDVVLGNPPWDVMQLGEEEYFASRLPEIAELTGAARKKAIKALEAENAAAFAEYQTAKRRFEAGNEFARASGRFDLTARGKVNTYGLFAELFKLTLSHRGRGGIIVPTDILSGDALKEFFQELVNRGSLKSSIAFENEEFLFPGIANVNRFALITLGPDDPEKDEFWFAFYLRRPEQIEDRRRFFSLHKADFRLLNPNTRTCPVFRSRADAELTAKIYARVPVLVDETKGAAGNPWQVKFREGLFNMTSDSGLFRTAAQLRSMRCIRDGNVWRTSNTLETYLPLYEGKFIWHFDHRFSSYHNLGKMKGRGGRGLPPVTLREYSDPTFEVEPRYWVDQKEVEVKLTSLNWKNGWLLGWRDVANAKVERTMVTTVIPPWLSVISYRCIFLLLNHRDRQPSWLTWPPFPATILFAKKWLEHRSSSITSNSFLSFQPPSTPQTTLHSSSHVSLS